MTAKVNRTNEMKERWNVTETPKENEESIEFSSLQMLCDVLVPDLLAQRSQSMYFVVCYCCCCCYSAFVNHSSLRNHSYFSLRGAESPYEELRQSSGEHCEEFVWRSAHREILYYFFIFKSDQIYSIIIIIILCTSKVENNRAASGDFPIEWF